MSDNFVQCDAIATDSSPWGIQAMKPYVILHIGLPKTGTTAIQRTLNDFLEDPSFEYFRVGGAKNCNHLYTLFSNQPERFHEHRRLGSNPAQILALNQSLEQELLNQLDKHRDKNCIISGEAFVSLKESELLNFRNFLNRYFTQILVVGYVRTPRSAIESGFQQDLRSSEFSERLTRNPFVNLKDFERFDRVFGKENVKLWKFDRASLLHGDVVEDFCHRLGIKMPTERQNEPYNESLSAPALKLLYTYRTFYPCGKGKAAVEANQRLVGALRKIKGKKLRISPKVIGPFLDQLREQIATIEERIGASLSEDMVAEKDDIEAVADLLVIDNTSIDKLKLLFGDESPPGIAHNLAPKQIADIMHSLSELLTNRRDIEKSLKSQVEQAMRAAPEQLGNMSKVRSIALLQAVLAIISQKIDTAEDGMVKVEKLGQFKILHAEKMIDGKMVSFKNIVFNPANDVK
jgi:hypothetical protein